MPDLGHLGLTLPDHRRIKRAWELILRPPHSQLSLADAWTLCILKSQLLILCLGQLWGVTYTPEHSEQDRDKATLHATIHKLDPFLGFFPFSFSPHFPGNITFNNHSESASGEPELRHLGWHRRRKRSWRSIFSVSSVLDRSKSYREVGPAWLFSLSFRG